MTDADQQSRPCAAIIEADLMVCDRCGLEWAVDADDTAKPKCKAIKFADLRARLRQEVANAHTAMDVARALVRDGGHADVAAARRRFAELNKISLIIELCTTNEAIKEWLGTPGRWVQP